MKAYYNENNKYAAEWLRELIKAGLIADGYVDERSITEVKATDLIGFGQCHWFAGISGWSLALRLAGIPDDVPVWTASLPCQPWSGAGKQLGAADDRHLWPVFFNLVQECRPERILGEQVERAVGLGWLDGVQTDLESQGYTFGATVLGAHSVGGPHRRQRIYWVADAQHAERRAELEAAGARERRAGPRGSGGLVNPGGVRCDSAVAGDGRGEAGAGSEPGPVVARSGESGGLADVQQPGLEGHAGDGNDGGQPGRLGEEARGPASPGGGDGERLGNAPVGGCGVERDAARQGSCGHPLSASWSGFDYLKFRDGKTRRIESGTLPLVAGFPERMELLRGYGNSICPPLAAVFIQESWKALDALNASA